MVIIILISPLCQICLHIYALSYYQDGTARGMLDLAAGGEAFFESFPQLVLQLHIIFRGYDGTTLQYFTIAWSAFTLAKASIQFDIVGNQIELNGKIEHVIYMLKVAPLYVTGIIFRCTSLALTLAYFRMFAIVPITIYVFELVWIVVNNGKF